MKFAIRADASLQIGSGHIMRCLTLADLLKKQGHDITFICREHDGHLADFIGQKGFDVQLLAKSENLNFSKNFEKSYAHSDWLGVSENDDFAECQPILQKLQPDWLIIDHYAIGKNWEVQAKQLLPNIKILVIDDLADREHNCEMLLDQTFGREIEDYQQLVPKTCRLLLGTRYALLREEFSHWREICLNRRKNLTQPKTILVNLGGVDKDNITLQILQRLQNFCEQSAQAFTVTVVMGKTAPHIDSVQNFAKTANFTCEVLIGVSNMAELMANADIAIGAGGSTSWERCCLGVPTLLVVLADNQRHLAKVLEDKQAVISLDDLANFDKAFTLKFEKLLNNANKLSKKASQIVDGQGAARVSNQIDFYPKLQNGNVRKATLADTEMIWQWRNHADVRQWMFGQDEIALSDHEKWFGKQLENPNVHLLVFELNNEPLGFVNFTQITVDKYQRLQLPKSNSPKSKPNEKTASWGFYLSPNSPKGQGLGFALGVLAIARIFNSTDIGKITAQVLEYNTASLALHRKLGFSEKGMLKQHFGVGDKVFDVVEFELRKHDFLF